MIKQKQMTEKDLDQVAGGHGLHIRRKGTTDWPNGDGFDLNYWHVLTERPSQKLKPVMDGRPLPYNFKYRKA